MNTTFDELLLRVASVFGLQGDIEINICLELIARHFGFTYGGIYEIDQFNNFNLKERFINGFDFRTTFAATDLNELERESISKKELFYFHDFNNIKSKTILEFFKASSIIARVMRDSVNNACAIIVLCNKENKAPVNDINLSQFSTVAGMILAKISKRVCENKLVSARQTMESILDNTGIDIYVNDFNTHEILYVNKSMAAPYGGIEKFKNEKCWKILFPEQNGQCSFCPQKNLIDEDGNPTKIYTWDYKRALDGSWFRVFSAAFRWTDGRLAHVVSSANITDNKRNEELIQYMAHYDELTKLPNRRMLLVDCERRINASTAETVGYVLFFDIDRFKAINDNLGHDAGDEFLVQLGEFFQSISSLKGVVYRNGGDEFVAILDGDIGEDGLNTLTQDILQRFKLPWKLKNGEVYCDISIGVACFPHDGITAERLLNKADKAMYYSKNHGGGCVSFSKEL